ncbi:MAG: hypothetical protein E6H96_10380 [Chloroflexi bacterium]|nr:MAG: hypothetical protein E6H96_10380 [Chloroflexota bacterium]
MSPKSKPPGETATTDPPLPMTRQELLALHREARRRRDSVPLGSREYVKAAEEVGRIEVQIARAERVVDSPLP